MRQRHPPVCPVPSPTGRLQAHVKGQRGAQVAFRSPKSHLGNCSHHDPHVRGVSYSQARGTPVMCHRPCHLQLGASEPAGWVSPSGTLAHGAGRGGASPTEAKSSGLGVSLALPPRADATPCPISRRYQEPQCGACPSAPRRASCVAWGLWGQVTPLGPELGLPRMKGRVGTPCTPCDLPAPVQRERGSQGPRAARAPWGLSPPVPTWAKEWPGPGLPDL